MPRRRLLSPLSPDQPNAHENADCSATGQTGLAAFQRTHSRRPAGPGHLEHLVDDGDEVGSGRVPVIFAHAAVAYEGGEQAGQVVARDNDGHPPDPVVSAPVAARADLVWVVAQVHEGGCHNLIVDLQGQQAGFCQDGSTDAAGEVAQEASLSNVGESMLAK